MVFGDQESASGSNDIPQASGLIVAGEADPGPEGRNVMNQLLADGWQNQNHLRRDVQTDADLTRSVIARRMSFVAEK